MSITPTIREAAGRLRAVQTWANDHFPAYQQVVPYRDEVLARYQPVFAPESIPSLTEEEFRGFLLFDNNRHWALHRQGPQMCADMDRLREALVILVDEGRPIEERLDLLIPRVDASMVRGLGRGTITGILLVIAPEKYGVWNNTSEAGLVTLGVFPEFARGASFSERYLTLNAVLNDLAREVGVDLWTLDFLFYALAEHGVAEGEDGKVRVVNEETDAALRFDLERYLHEFMRDNWDRISLGAEWALYERDGDVVGFKYPTGAVGEIDLLARHRVDPRWLVIELKRDQSSDVTVGQVLRYMGWVREHLAADGGTVEGLIIARSGDERLRYALQFTHNVGLRFYEIDFRLVEPDGQ